MLQIGQRIYYTGDMANCEDTGTIIESIPADNYMPLHYTIHLDNGRVLRGVYHLMFAKERGQRFWLLEDWEADRKVKLEAFYNRMKVKQEVK